ncbi:MAG: hypothetical protein GY895_17340, partial [Phycisphaera sp.]|nr:hypothetical protein [Phycisphaera sp.]
MTHRILPDDLERGTWIAIRRPRPAWPTSRHPEADGAQTALDPRPRPSGLRPGVPLRVTVVDLPFVHVSAMDLSGRPDRCEIVDLDEHMIVGCDLDTVECIQDEIQKSRCRHQAYRQHVEARSAPLGRPAEDSPIDRDRRDPLSNPA